MNAVGMVIICFKKYHILSLVPLLNHSALSLSLFSIPKVIWVGWSHYHIITIMSGIWRGPDERVHFDWLQEVKNILLQGASSSEVGKSLLKVLFRFSRSSDYISKQLKYAQLNLTFRQNGSISIAHLLACIKQKTLTRRIRSIMQPWKMCAFMRI